MSSHQMICHLSDSLQAALREKYISPSTSLFKRTILKPLALWVPIPWPHGFKTRLKWTSSRVVRHPWSFHPT